MKNTFKKSRWTRVLAGLFAVVMVITSLGVMPAIATETEPAATVVVAKMTFDDGVAYSATLAEATSETFVTDTVSAPGHTFVYKSNASRTVNGTKTWYGGEFTETLVAGETGKYYVAPKLMYTDDSNASKGANPEVWYKKTDNEAFANLAYGESGKQVVYEMSVNPSLGFALSFRSDVPGIYTVLSADSSGIHLIDTLKDNKTSKLDTYSTSNANDWYNVRLVHNNGLGTDGKDTADLYVNDTLCAKGVELTTSVSNLEYATSNARAIFEGAFDNFAVTKYDGIQYDPDDAEVYKNPVITSLVDLDFNGDEYGKYITDPTNNPNPHSQNLTKDDGSGNQVPDNGNIAGWNDFEMKNGPTATVVKDDEGDYSVKFENVDSNGDKLWLADGLNSVAKHPGLNKDEQLHISAKIHTAVTINAIRALTYKNYGDTTRTIDGVDQRLVVPILSYNATNRALRIDNGGYIAGFGTADVANASLGTITLPENTWVTLDLVYTKKETKSTVDVYIDGNYRGTGILGATYLLDGPFARWQIANGHYDDIAVTSYTGSAAVDPDDLTQGTPVEPEDKTFFSYDGDDTVSIADRESKATPGDGHADNNSAVVAPGIEYAKFGKAAGDLAYTSEPYKDWADDVADEDKTDENALWIWKRMALPNLNQSSPANPFADVVDIYMTYDIIHDGRELAVGEANYLTLAGAPVVQNAETKELSRYGGLNFITTCVEEGELVFYVNDGKATAGASLPVATGSLKQWHNVAVQFNARSKTFEFYLDGVLAYQGDFVGNFIGIHYLYFNVGANGYWVDNIKAATGEYVPAPKAEVEVTLPETAALPEGYSWAEDGKTLNINKAALKAYVANAYTTEDGEVVYLDAEGNVTDDLAEVDQIAVRATADGSLHYYPIKARTGMARFDLGENRWMIDVADGKGAMGETSKVFVARYDDNKMLSYIKAYDVDAIDGDTWFVDVTDGIQKGDKVLIFNDGTTPVYKDTTDINVVCWGDSLTEGVAGNGVTYTDELAKLLDYNVINMGVAGESLITIGARSGAYNIVLGEDLSIPANRTPVDIELSSTELYDENDYAGRIAPCNTNRGGWTPATIILENGTEIEGKIRTTYDPKSSPRVLTSATFTRDEDGEDGEDVVAPAGSKIKIAAHDVDGDINIYWAGTNMGWDDTDLGSDAVKAENIIVALKKMILENAGVEFESKEDVLAAEIPADEKFIVIGLASGGANSWKDKDKNKDINEALAEEFGDNFIDIRAYFASEQALTDAGITSSEEDEKPCDKPNNIVPHCFHGGFRYSGDRANECDAVHFNALGYKLIAKQVYLKMQALGY